MHTPSAHLPCPEQSPSHVSLISHASPAQSGWHSQKLSSRHSPCCSHPAGHSVRRWHASPSKPGSHTHVPFAALHRPLPEQPAGHAAGASHAVPLHPDEHSHRRSSGAHDPRPSAHEQLFGQSDGQSTPRPAHAGPYRPGAHAHTPCSQRPAEAPEHATPSASRGHGSSVAQSAPEYPAGQRQPSAAQTPRPEQLDKHCEPLWAGRSAASSATSPPAYPSTGAAEPTPVSYTHLTLPTIYSV